MSKIPAAPTKYAVHRWEEVRAEAERLLPKHKKILQGEIEYSDLGALREEWTAGGNLVRLVIGADVKEKPYIYTEIGDMCDSDRLVTGERLLYWLQETGVLK